MMNDAQEYLMRVQLYDTHIENKLAELQRLNELALKITSTMGGEVVSGTRAQDKLGDAVSELVDYADEIRASISEYKQRKKEISETIEKIGKADQVSVLHKIYFEHKSWGEIAAEMHMTERNAQYIHGRALQSVRRIFREKAEKTEKVFA